MEFVKCRKAAGERINSDQQTAKQHLASRDEKSTPVGEQTKQNGVESGAARIPQKSAADPTPEPMQSGVLRVRCPVKNKRQTDIKPKIRYKIPTEARWEVGTARVSD